MGYVREAQLSALSHWFSAIPHSDKGEAERNRSVQWKRNLQQNEAIASNQPQPTYKGCLICQNRKLLRILSEPSFFFYKTFIKQENTAIYHRFIYLNFDRFSKNNYVFGCLFVQSYFPVSASLIYGKLQNKAISHFSIS